jgi:hypothetical protein
MADLEDEASWLRFRVRRLRVILRLVSRADFDKALVEAALKELIADAEARLDGLERK